MVAENSATCLYSGVSARMRSTSSWKPILSISSASSRTRYSRFEQVERALLEVVDHATGGADDDLRAAAQARQLHAVALAAVDRQHVQAGDVRGVLAERLGDLQRELTRRGQDQRLRDRFRSTSMRDRIGTANAAVLPVPVCARPTTSLPASSGGMVAAWIGEGVS